MERKRKNPWQGLKSYSEGKVLYGRDKEIVELSQKILYNTQTIIYGRSGIGKSSLLKAGVFPVLRKHNLFPVYIRLSHSETDDYGYASQVFDAVEKSLSELRVENVDSEAGYDVVSGYKEEVIPVVNEHAEGLWEYFHRHRFFYKPLGEEEPVQITPVLVFDQFEELFTLQDDRAKMLSLFKELEFLLNDVCPDELLQQGEQEGSAAEGSVKSGSLIKTVVSFKVRENRYLKGNNFHLVMSVREDFLSHLERNSTNIPSLKHNRYCLLPLSEDRAAEVIMKPVPGLVSLQVAKEIISKVTGVPATDFEIDDNPELEVDSAILSLFLSELYAKKGTDEPAITLAMVEKFGSNIISDFYQETMDHISKPSVEYLERRLVTKEGRRDAIYWEQALRHNVTQKELDFLLGQRLLHRYSWRDGIRVEFSHDILCPIISKRRKEREAEAERAKARRTKRILMLSLALSLLCVGGLVYWYIYSEKKYQKEYVDECVEIYADFVYRNTWPEGVKPLSRDEARHYGNTYWIYKYGTKARHPYKMEVRNGYGDLVATDDFALDLPLLKNKDLLDKTSSVACVEYVGDANNEYCVLEKGFDVKHKEIYRVTKSINVDERSFLSVYTDPRGYPIMYNDSTVLYLRTYLDDNGFEGALMAYDEKGQPIDLYSGVSKISSSSSSNGIISGQEFFFYDKLKIVSPDLGFAGFEILKYSNDGLKPCITVFYDKNGCLNNSKDLKTVLIQEYDDYGREISSQCYWTDGSIHKDAFLQKMKEGKVLFDNSLSDYNLVGEGDIILYDASFNDSVNVHSVTYEYNDYGCPTKISYGGKNGDVAEKADGMVTELYDYDADGKIKCLKGVTVSGDTAVYTYKNINDEMITWENYRLSVLGDTIWTVKRYIENGEQVLEETIDEDSYSKTTLYDDGSIKTIAYYYSGNGAPYAVPLGVHKITNDIESGNRTKKFTTTKYDLNNNLICTNEIALSGDTIECYKVVLEIDSVKSTVCQKFFDINGGLSKKCYSIEYEYSSSDFQYVKHYKDNSGARFKQIYPDIEKTPYTTLYNVQSLLAQPIGSYQVDEQDNHLSNSYLLLNGRFFDDEFNEVFLKSFKSINIENDSRFVPGSLVIGVDGEICEFGNIKQIEQLLNDKTVGHSLTMYNDGSLYEVALKPNDTIYKYMVQYDEYLVQSVIDYYIQLFNQSGK